MRKPRPTRGLPRQKKKNDLRYDDEALRFIIFLSPEYGDDRTDFPV